MQYGNRPHFGAFDDESVKAAEQFTVVQREAVDLVSSLPFMSVR